MSNNLVEAGQPHSLPYREALRAELLATRTAFHELLDLVSGDRWQEKSPTTDWTIGEVLYHLTWAIEYLPKEIARAQRGKGMFNQPKWLGDPLSYWLVRLGARKNSPASLLRRYDAAIEATLLALEVLPDTDWEKGAEFYGEGFFTVAGLFKTPAQHLSEHTASLKA